MLTVREAGDKIYLSGVGLLSLTDRELPDDLGDICNHRDDLNLEPLSEQP